MKITLVPLILLALFAAAIAQPQQSENFRITKSAIDAGGASSTSTDFRLYSALGQSTPVGAQSSADFVLYAGYLSPSFAVSPLSPIPDLVIQFVSPDVHLHWNPVFGAERYKVFRDTSAVFTPATANLIGAVTDTFYVDVNAVDLTPLRYYYCVEASNTPHPLTLQPPVAPTHKAALKKTVSPQSK
jgi:hypothetical protein